MWLIKFIRAAWSSRTTIQPAPRNASSSHRFSIQMCIHQEPFAFRSWTKKKTGAQQSPSNRSFWASKTCWTSQTSKIPLKQKLTQSTGELLDHFNKQASTNVPVFQSKPFGIRKARPGASPCHGRSTVNPLSCGLTTISTDIHDATPFIPSRSLITDFGESTSVITLGHRTRLLYNLVFRVI